MRNNVAKTHKSCALHRPQNVGAFPQGVHPDQIHSGEGPDIRCGHWLATGSGGRVMGTLGKMGEADDRLGTPHA